MIPGNPAVARYYQSWIKEIQNRNNQLSITYATSYVLFDRKLNYIKYDLAMQKHYEDLLFALPTTEKITLLAHSVGSYFALRLLNKYPEKIEKVIIMFPYIGYSTIKSLKIVGIPYVIDRLFPLAELVSWTKNVFQKWDEHVAHISNTELTACLRFGVRQCVYFNKHKFDTQTISPSNREKIHFLYTKNDRWCPEQSIDLLKQVSHSKETEIRHDFITDINSRARMIDELMLVL